MKNRLLNLLFLTLLFITQTSYAAESLSAKQFDPQAKQKAQSAFEQANIYAKQNKYEKALEYLKTSYEYEQADGTAFNLGIVYEKMIDYDNAIKWYKKAYEMGDIGGGYNTGYLYDVKKHDFKNAIIWYKKAAKKGHKKAINNLGEVYHDLNDNITATAYILASIEYGYGEKGTFEYLRKTWKIDKTTLKKAYEFQKKLDIPKYYTGGIH